MLVIQQHDAIVDVFATLDGTVDDGPLRRLRIDAKSLEKTLDNQFNLLIVELVKAVEFNRLYGSYVYEGLPDYPNVHLNLLNELRALKSTILGLEILDRRNATIFHDINIRLRPYARRLAVLTAVSGERRQRQENERTARTQNLSRYVLVITGLVVLVGVGILILLIARDQSKRKIKELESRVGLEALAGIEQGVLILDDNSFLFFLM